MSVFGNNSSFSNFSNISLSIPIMPEQNSDSGFFKVRNNQAEGPHPQENQININDIPFQQQSDMNGISLLDKIRGNQNNGVKFTGAWMLFNNQNHNQSQESQQEVVESSSVLLSQVKTQKQKRKNIKKNKTTRQKKSKLPKVKITQQQQDSEKKNKRLKNQTKNIPKNYGKAIITFIEKEKQLVRLLADKYQISYEDFEKKIFDHKKNINTIANLRTLWLDSKDQGNAKLMRVLSSIFLRKYAFQYIFNSRICNYGSHIKYRHRLLEALKDPDSFKHIKDY